MEDYQLQVIEEERQLEERLDRLQKFLTTRRDVYVRMEDLDLLVLQADIMQAYLRVLNIRIQGFQSET
jgi:hypothetical protein